MPLPLIRAEKRSKLQLHSPQLKCKQWPRKLQVPRHRIFLKCHIFPRQQRAAGTIRDIMQWTGRVHFFPKQEQAHKWNKPQAGKEHQTKLQQTNKAKPSRPLSRSPQRCPISPSSLKTKCPKIAAPCQSSMPKAVHKYQRCQCFHMLSEHLDRFWQESWRRRRSQECLIPPRG